jgi:long-chain fatty acid transport protein
VSWPQDTGFRSVATKGSLVYIRVNPAMAIKLGENFSIGGGVTVNYVNMVLEQGLRGTVLPFRNFYRFEGDGWCVGYNLGALWKPDERVSIGASFRSSTTVGLDGKTEFEQQPILFPIQSRMARSEFTFPLGVVVGLSYRPTPKWNLEFDADYTDWSSMGTAIIQMEKPPFPLRRRTPVSLQWQPSWMYEFGVTRYFGPWHVSGGYVFNENSVPNKFYTPLAADMDRHFFSVGTGVQGKSLSLDVAYQLGYGPAHTVTGSTPPSQPGLFAGQTANGTYKFTSQAVILTVGLHF